MTAPPNPHRRRRAAGLLTAALGCAACAACAGRGPFPSPTLPPSTTTTTPAVSTTALATTSSAPAAIPLRIGVTASIAHAIPFVLADEGTGLGPANGLAVTTDIYADGPQALAALLAGEIDAAFPDGPSALAALADGHCLQAPLVFLDRDTMRLVGRSDLISSDDLIGRKVATVTGSAGEVALRMWLSDEGVPWGEVTVVSTRPEDMPAALSGGLVDAVVWSEPVPAAALAACGEEACRYVGEMGASYREVVPLSVGCSWQRGHRNEAMTRLVRAWLEAKEYVRNNRAEAAAITAGRLHLTAREVADLWEQHNWPQAWAADLADDQLAMLEAYAAYLVAAGDLAEAPDICTWVDGRWLREVAPSLVTLDEHGC
jgi:ABC-type nitrate/sulfonate/bicarbonate transport system substrate-binding protein